MFAKAISKEQINMLPVKVFEGTIHLIEDLDSAQEALQMLASARRLGFDTETKPAFRKGQHNQVALMQLATETDVFLFRLNKIGMPPALCQILESPDVLKIGAAVMDDLKALSHWGCRQIRGFVDLQSLAKSYGIESISLQKITAIVLQFKISKRQQVSNWEADHLTEAQLRYAATDSWVGLRIFEHMQQHLGDHFTYNTISRQ